MSGRWIVFCLAIMPQAAHAQQSWRSADHVAAIPQSRLDTITERGRAIAAYDKAAWRASDAVALLRPDTAAVQAYIARRNADGRWEVVFGRASANADTFYIANRAVQSLTSDTAFLVPPILRPIPDVEYYARAFRALSAASRELGGVASRPYNSMVVPADANDEWFVYFVPAPTVTGVWPLGADVRLRVSADGRRVVERRRLHNEVIEFRGASKDGKQLAAGMHSAVLADQPEDTDVFHVLTRTPRVPEYVVTRSYYFAIAIDGRISAFDRESVARR
jgi:hypothetical protein